MAGIMSEETAAIYRRDMRNVAQQEPTDFITMNLHEDSDSRSDSDSDSDSDTPPDHLSLYQKAKWLVGKREQRDIKRWKLDCANEELLEFQDWQYRRTLEYTADVRRARRARYRLDSGEQLSDEERDRLNAQAGLVENKYDQGYFTLARFYDRGDAREFQMGPALQKYKDELWRGLPEEEVDGDDADGVEEQQSEEIPGDSWDIWALVVDSCLLPALGALVSAWVDYVQPYLGPLAVVVFLILFSRFLRWTDEWN